MSETADIANNLPAIILLSVWWAFLSMLEVLSNQAESARKSSAACPADEAQAAEDDRDYPQIREMDPQFSTDAFLQGACRAYEEILRAYALCDMKALHALLSPEVFQAFTDAFDARTARGETLELTFVGLRSAEIADVAIGSEAMEIAVLFRAEIIQAERSSTGDVIGGDPVAVATVADLWTFSRPLSSTGAGWTVVATDESLEPA